MIYPKPSNHFLKTMFWKEIEKLVKNCIVICMVNVLLNLNYISCIVLLEGKSYA